MNKKLSGAKLVLLPITQMGVNKFPYIEDLAKRRIKYIDFYPNAYLPDTADAGLTLTDSLSLTLADEIGNSYLIKDMPLSRFDYAETLGIRQPICNRISLQNCYVNCQNQSAVGKVAAFVFYYDLPEFSAKNRTDNVVVDSLSIPINTVVRYNQLPDEERMSLKRFRYIWLGLPTTTPDLQTGLSEAQLQNCYITLRKGSYNVVENMPLYLLYQIKMLDKTEFANIIFDFQSSFVTVGGAGTIPSPGDYTGKSVFINLAYEK